MSPIKIAVPKC